MLFFVETLIYQDKEETFVFLLREGFELWIFCNFILVGVGGNIKSYNLFEYNRSFWFRDFLS